MEKGLVPPESTDINLYSAPAHVLAAYKRLPVSLGEARNTALESEFLRCCLPPSVIAAYCLPRG